MTMEETAFISRVNAWLKTHSPTFAETPIRGGETIVTMYNIGNHITLERQVTDEYIEYSGGINDGGRFRTFRQRTLKQAFNLAAAAHARIKA
ncbi:MAG: hypothetical protein FWE17_00565 [Alphaproteobacteria bacterium]|nr:hypothetical protein [Alphaproteobacteria bacterium]MCL2758412.1 hypothetical protein [Alphaproteobacteria bacterium]